MAYHEDETLEFQIRLEFLHHTAEIRTMDGQFVKDLHQEVTQDDTLACALVSDEQRHPAWQRFCLKFKVFEGIGNVMGWLKIEPAEYEAANE